MIKKNKKNIFLTAFTIVTVSTILPTENVFANENEVPSLNVYNLNGSPKLEWATEMLEQNVLQRITFEDDTINQININPAGYAKNNQSIVTYDVAEGVKALEVLQTLNGKGNAVYYPATSSNSSTLHSRNKFYFEKNMNFSITMKVKSDGANINPTLHGGYVDYPNVLDYTVYDIKKGDKTFTAKNPSRFYKNQWIVVRQGTNKGDYTYSLVTDVNKETGVITVQTAFQEDFKSGQAIKVHGNSDTYFNSRTVNSNEWETVNFNLNNLNPTNYSLDRGLNFFLTYSVTNKLLIDDIKFGYATQVEVFKKGSSIYKGYLSDFHDTSVKDNIKPNTVNQINTTVSNDFKVQFNPVKPLDEGVKTSYTIQAIAQNGSRSEMSSPQEITVGGEVVKYKYTINSNKNTPTTLANTTNGLDFNVPINQLNLENDYIHIQAIDAANNVSSITTYKLKDIVNMNIVNDLYDKLDKVENSMNYNEFIQFIEEVEAMYGTNIPLDVKNKIQELASYHNANTAFLLLLEGDFILTTSDITSFGKTKLTAKKQVLYTNFVKEFNIIDARGTQQGYSITVSATPFIEDTFNGFVGEPVQLPIGTLALNPVNEVQQIGLVHNTQKPTPQTINSTIIDSGSVNILQAGKGQGMGEFVFNFGDKPLSMVVDSTTAKIDNVNYPSGTTPYTSTITWDLITGP